jgi:hypothetical protein
VILLRHIQCIFNHFIVVCGLESLVPISNSSVQNVIKWLQPLKSAELDGIPSFVMKGCSEIVVPVLRFIFNLSLSQNTFLTCGSNQQLSLFSKKGKLPLLEIIGSSLFLTIFLKFLNLSNMTINTDSEILLHCKQIV